MGCRKRSIKRTCDITKWAGKTSEETRWIAKDRLTGDNHLSGDECPVNEKKFWKLQSVLHNISKWTNTYPILCVVATSDLMFIIIYLFT